jgi:hypothetical protein
MFTPEQRKFLLTMFAGVQVNALAEDAVGNVLMVQSIVEELKKDNVEDAPPTA